MREIKFRAWYDGRMCDVYTIEPYNKRIQIAEGWIPIKYLEQYTCKKDKNGIEIYEGDIIKANGTFIKSMDVPDIVDPIFKVVFIHESFKLQDVNCDSGFMSISDHLSSLEVIGNIHEKKNYETR